MPLGGAGPSSMQSTIPPPVVPALHRGPGDVNLAMERMVRASLRPVVLLYSCSFSFFSVGGGRG